MTRTEHLTIILMEECAEVAHRASKCLRFGPSEIQPGQNETNATRLVREIADLTSVVEMLQSEIDKARTPGDILETYITEHKAQIERFLSYSKECGTLE